MRFSVKTLDVKKSKCQKWFIAEFYCLFIWFVRFFASVFADRCANLFLNIGILCFKGSVLRFLCKNELFIVLQIKC